MLAKQQQMNAGFAKESLGAAYFMALSFYTTFEGFYCAGAHLKFVLVGCYHSSTPHFHLH